MSPTTQGKGSCPPPLTPGTLRVGLGGRGAAVVDRARYGVLLCTRRGGGSIGPRRPPHPIAIPPASPVGMEMGMGPREGALAVPPPPPTPSGARGSPTRGGGGAQCRAGGWQGAAIGGGQAQPHHHHPPHHSPSGHGPLGHPLGAADDRLRRLLHGPADPAGDLRCLLEVTRGQLGTHLGGHVGHETMWGGGGRRRGARHEKRLSIDVMKCDVVGRE